MSEKKRSGAGKGLAVFGVIILLLGAALFIYGMSVIDWDFKQLSTFRYEYRTYEAENDEIDSIFVDFDQTNVRVEISETAQKYGGYCFSIAKNILTNYFTAAFIPCITDCYCCCM